MIRKLLPILLAVVGIASGVGAGFMLKPESETGELAETCPPQDHATPEAHQLPEADEADGNHEYVKLNNQFVVPVVKDERVAYMVVLSLSVEVTVGQKDSVFQREPKLRDAFLQVMFDHANLGGFAGTFTNSRNLNLLRTALLETGQDMMGDVITDVLIMDLVRQDV